MASIPLINRTAHSFASIEVKANGRSFYGHSAIDYTLKVDRTAVGSGVIPYAWTDGILSVSDLSITMLRDEFDALCVDLGQGYMDKPFIVSATYSAKTRVGKVLRVDLFKPCKMKQHSHTNKKGPDATEVKVDLDCLRPIINGLDPVELSDVLKALLR